MPMAVCAITLLYSLYTVIISLLIPSALWAVFIPIFARQYPHSNGYRIHFIFRLEFTKAIPYLLPFSML